MRRRAALVLESSLPHHASFLVFHHQVEHAASTMRVALLVVSEAKRKSWSAE
jgi:hypothetical protein